MSLNAKADQGGKGTESAEAAAEAADVSEEESDGSVNTLDEYLAGKDAEPGVSQHSEADDEEADESEEEADAEETEDSATEDTEDAEEETLDEDSDEESEDADADEEDEHDGLDLDDDQRKAFGKIIDRKVGKQVAKRKAAEEALETAEGRIAELETELETAGVPPAVQSGSVPEVMLAESDAEVDRFEADTRRMQKEAKRWLRRHDRDDELTIPQDDGDDATYSYEQIEDRLDELEDLLAEAIPQARKQVAARQAASAKAKEAYPKLFDRKSEAYQAMQKMLRKAPQLKALPDYQLMVGRMLAGEALESTSPKKKARKAPPKPRAAKPPETSTPTKTKTTPNRPTVKPGARTMDEYLGITQ